MKKNMVGKVSKEQTMKVTKLILKIIIGLVILQMIYLLLAEKLPKDISLGETKEIGRMGDVYKRQRYYISPSNELCELQTDLCKKRPNLRFGCVLLPSRGREGSSLGTATEEKGRMQIRGIYMRTAPITRSTMWIRAGINSFQYINIKIRRDINLQ